MQIETVSKALWINFHSNCSSVLFLLSLSKTFDGVSWQYMNYLQLHHLIANVGTVSHTIQQHHSVLQKTVLKNIRKFSEKYLCLLKKFAGLEFCKKQFRIFQFLLVQWASSKSSIWYQEQQLCYIQENIKNEEQ